MLFNFSEFKTIVSDHDSWLWCRLRIETETILKLRMDKLALEPEERFIV